MTNRGKTKKQLIEEIQGLHNMLLKSGKKPSQNPADESTRQRGSVESDSTGQLWTVEGYPKELGDCKDTDVSLWQSEQKYRALFDNLTEFMAIDELLYDDRGSPVDWRVLDVNSAFLHAARWPREQIVGRRVTEIYGIDRAPELFLNHFAPVVETGKPAQFEGYFEPLRMHLLVSAFHLGGSRFVTLTTDMTERRQMEAELRELYQRLNYHVEASPLAAIEWGPDMRLIRWSAAAERIFGWHADEVVGKRMEDFPWICEDDQAQVAQVSSDLKSGRDPQRFSANRNYRKDGTIIDCEWYNSSLVDEAGQLRSILSLVLDVSERKQMEAQIKKSRDELELRVRERTVELEEINRVLREEIAERRKVETALRESETRFREVLENSLDVSYRRDLTLDMYDYMSPRIADLSGYRAAEMIDMSTDEIISLIHPDDQQEVRNGIREATLEGKERFRLEYRFRHKTGSYRWFSNLITIVKDAEGKPLHRVGSIRDTTERKNAEEALADSEKRLRHLSSELLNAQEAERKRIAAEIHDSIGSSLSAIKLSLGVLVKGIKGDPASAKCLEKTISVTQQAIDEARTIMNALRPSMLDDFGLVATIRYFCESFHGIHENVIVERRIEIDDKDVPEELKIVIYRVMQEAFHNISKYAKAEFVGISLRKQDGILEFSIQDDGTGFDLQATVSSSKQGGGLGLTSMRERTMLSGGSFEIQSAPGEGTKIAASWNPAVPFNALDFLLSGKPHAGATGHSPIADRNPNRIIQEFRTHLIEIKSRFEELCRLKKELENIK